MADSVRSALDQVRELRAAIVERGRFRGYSGKARAASGAVALAAAAAMASDAFPDATGARVAGWGAVFAVAFALNLGAVFHWFLTDPTVDRDWVRMRPLLDFLPSLGVGAILTGTFLARGGHEYLFGTWMCLYGLGHLASRAVLPGAIVPLGMFYIVCGGACLASPHVVFADPWPMGVVFFVGECAGGWIFHRNRIAAPAAARRKAS